MSKINCQHGRLARQCNECFLERENKELQEKLDDTNSKLATCVDDNLNQENLICKLNIELDSLKSTVNSHRFP